MLPGDTPHFHWPKSGADITQVTALGPISQHDVDPGRIPGRSGQLAFVVRLEGNRSSTIRVMMEKKKPRISQPIA